jgi:hypothetical protein
MRASCGLDKPISSEHGGVAPWVRDPRWRVHGSALGLARLAGGWTLLYTLSLTGGTRDLVIEKGETDTGSLESCRNDIAVAHTWGGDINRRKDKWSRAWWTKGVLQFAFQRRSAQPQQGTRSKDRPATRTSSRPRSSPCPHRSTCLRSLEPGLAIKVGEGSARCHTHPRSRPKRAAPNLGPWKRVYSFHRLGVQGHGASIGLG